MLERLIRLVFPPKCIFCGCVLGVNSTLEVCSFCIKSIPFIPDVYLKLGGETSYSNYCDGVMCVCEYEGVIRNSLRKYKFFNKVSYYRAFGRLLSEKVKRMTNCHEFDIIAYVPLSRQREKERGYNQALLIARVLGRYINVPVINDLLVRTKHTQSQSLLTRTERYTNIKGAFKILEESRVKNKSVILVDDVITTGSTAQECSRVLKEAGAKKVVAAVIATGRKY